MEAFNIEEHLRRQELRRQETNRLTKLAKRYMGFTEQGPWRLPIKWITSIGDIDLLKLKSKLHLPEFPSGYIVVWAKPDEIILRMGEAADKVFPKEDLWHQRNDTDIAGVLELIESNIDLIPPIFHANDHAVNIVDGNHRFAICRYMDVEYIPFLIKTCEVQFLSQLGLEFSYTNP